MDRDPMQFALSTDIVMDNVLSYLKTGDLLSCRLVSKFWNKAASLVLRKRSAMMKTISSEGDLMELNDRMDQSSDFPFTGLNVKRPWELHSARAMRFFKNYGAKFTRLRTDVDLLYGLHHLDPFLNHLTRLSILEVFPSYISRMACSELAIGPKKPKLPSVRIMRFLGLSSEVVSEEVLLAVITAASPSVQIECLGVNLNMMSAFKKAGRLRAVSFMKFDAENRDNRNRWRVQIDQLLSTESPSLTKLDFHRQGCLSSDGLEKILFSSQNTLKELHLDGSWFSEYSWENIPILAKLTKLSLKVAKDFCNGSLFRGRHGNKFPVLKELHLRFHHENEDGNPRAAYPSGLFVVPSVTRLGLDGFFDEHGIEQLAQGFPNVIDIRLDYRCYDDDPFKIWNVLKFKCLEALRIWNFPIRQPSKDYVNMDSFLTGIPAGICENLRKREPLNLINSPFNEVLRDNPSILRLENLQELVVCIDSEISEPATDPPFISMVSVRYALEMMPNLRWKFVYEASFFDEQERSLMEAAFEHVQPCIKLEPFFY